MRTQADTVEWLLAHGADAEVLVQGETALTALLEQGADASAAIHALLRHGASPAGAGGLAAGAAAGLRDAVMLMLYIQTIGLQNNRTPPVA